MPTAYIMPDKEAKEFQQIMQQLLKKYKCDLGFIMLYRKIGLSKITLEATPKFQPKYEDLGMILMGLLDTILQASKQSGSIIAGFDMIDKTFQFFYRTRQPTNRVAD